MFDASEWRTRVGETWAEEWRRTDRSFAELADALDAAILEAAPDTGAVLDIGCGAGSTSLALAAARPTLAVTGIDLSEDLLAVARARGADLANLRFQVADASDPPPPILGGAHAMAVSRHGVMFFADPVAAFRTIRALLVPAAPLVFSCFASVAENPWANELIAAITGAPPPPSDHSPGPFAFADADHVAGLLGAAGWRDAAPRAVHYRYVAGAGPDPVGDALAFFRRIGPTARLLAAVADEARPAVLDRLRAELERRVVGDTVEFPAAAWIWSARA